MNVSVLVALRDDSPDQFRIRLWDFVRARLTVDHPDYEVVVASDDGLDPFNKCVALNRAAAQAAGEVFYILDSDSFVRPEQVRTAVAELEGWSRPWTRKVKLNERDTATLLGRESWDGTLDALWIRRAENRNSYWAAPPLLLTRDLFYAAGGLDERFRGWGQEDTAFAWALKALSGPAQSVRGDCLHLWHPRIGKSGRDQWTGQEGFHTNRELAAAYRRAARSPEAMQELIASRVVEV